MTMLIAAHKKITVWLFWQVFFKENLPKKSKNASCLTINTNLIDSFSHFKAKAVEDEKFRAIIHCAIKAKTLKKKKSLC